jgi:hypothetical protein
MLRGGGWLGFRAIPVCRGGGGWLGAGRRTSAESVDVILTGTPLRGVGKIDGGADFASGGPISASTLRSSAYTSTGRTKKPLLS